MLCTPHAEGNLLIMIVVTCVSRVPKVHAFLCSCLRVSYLLSCTVWLPVTLCTSVLLGPLRWCGAFLNEVWSLHASSGFLWSRSGVPLSLVVLPGNSTSCTDLQQLVPQD